MERCKPPVKGIRVRMPELPLQKGLSRAAAHDASTPDDVPGKEHSNSSSDFISGIFGFTSIYFHLK
jgi:hypothetical protein